MLIPKHRKTSPFLMRFVVTVYESDHYCGEASAQVHSSSAFNDSLRSFLSTPWEHESELNRVPFFDPFYKVKKDDTGNASLQDL